MNKIIISVIAIIILIGWYIRIEEFWFSKKSAQLNIVEKPSYPIDSNVLTTLDQTIIPIPVPTNSPKLLPTDLAKFKENGYGLWKTGSGLAYEKRLDLMSTTYNSSWVRNGKTLLNFFTISDIHISDEESPSQWIFVGYKGGNSSGYSPVMLYTTQVLDATIQTINALNKKSQFDFWISLGDNINNAQYNELRWFIDVLDGKIINPDSGSKDDPIPWSHNDYQDEYKAAGLDKSIPWYQTLGNHDHLWMWAYPLNDELRATYIGRDILNMGNVLTDPLGVKSKWYYMGAIDWSTQYWDVIWAWPVADFTTIPQVPSADKNRRTLSSIEWMNEFNNTTTKPKWHWFSNNSSSYSFEPKTNLPLKVIVLDNTQSNIDFNVKEQWYLEDKRFNWLISELDKWQAENKLMIVSAHIPAIAVGYSNHSPISRKQLIAKLNSYPNLILWISGHVHRNIVTPLKSPDINHPEFWFWEVETSSLRDFPQQFRTFQIVRNSDNNISIFSTNVSLAVKEGSPAAISRSYSIAAQQIFNNKIPLLPTGSYNVELIKQLTPEMQWIIARY